LITDLLSLLAGAAGIFLVKDHGGFRWAVLIGLLLAGACWFGCYHYTRLWNKRFRVKPIHQVLCGVAALITLVFSVFYPALAYVRDAAEASITVWEGQIRLDGLWAAGTFREAYYAVRKLGIEDFRGIPGPGAPRSWIPTAHDKSRQEAAAIYASSACAHFASNRPFLSKVVWARPRVPAEVVFADVHHWHQTNPNYPPERAISLAAEQIRTGLVAQAPRLVSTMRFVAIILFLLAQALPFGLVGWAAYRDIKVKV